MLRSLVTGGAGFIGSHLAEALVARGDRVTILDNFSTGSRDNIKGFSDRARVVDGSILDPEALKAATSGGVDLVFHLAAMVSVPRSVAEPILCHELCATGTLNVLLASMEAGARRIVYSGTSAAYGDSAKCPIAEESPLDPLSPYAAGKLAGELLCQTWNRLGRIEAVRLRYFNVFGPRQDPRSPYSGVISLFTSAMLAGKQPTIFGDGLQTRDFVFVEDVVRANLLAAESADAPGLVFNVGTGESKSLLDLLRSLNTALGTTVAPIFGPDRAGDVRHSQADISCAREVLGFQPETSLDEGIVRLISHLKS